MIINKTMKFKKEYQNSIHFQAMRSYLGIKVRNFCSGCGEEIHEPIYCEDCQKQLERIKILKRKFK